MDGNEIRECISGTCALVLVRRYMQYWARRCSVHAARVQQRQTPIIIKSRLTRSRLASRASASVTDVINSSSQIICNPIFQRVGIMVVVSLATEFALSHLFSDESGNLRAMYQNRCDNPQDSVFRSPFGNQRIGTRTARLKMRIGEVYIH